MEEEFFEGELPVIAQDFKERFSKIPNITGSYWETGVLGAEYFLNKGYYNFAFYGFNNIVWSRERAEGFEDTIRKAGYEVNYFEHKKSRSTDIWYYKSKSLSKWLRNLPKPVALMACDDNQGVHIVEACIHNKIRVPQDVAILGVDNDVTLCELSDPRLSSIDLDIERAGFESAQVLDEMIRTGKKDNRDIVVGPVKVITRSSTDMFASADAYVAEALTYIHKNIDRNLVVDQVVKEVPLSRRALEKRFLQITGQPVYKYITKVRMEKLAQKLLDTDQSVFEIAVDLGFQDSKNLARQFKQMTGYAPGEYRKKFGNSSLIG
jgi:LacI family transcriptional regulator